MFNINDTQTKSQMNNFWSYLDELAENNPDEYKKFISQQMKKGYENIKEENEDKILKVNTFLCLRFKLLQFNKNEIEITKNNIINIHENNKNEIFEVPKILFSFDFQSNAYNKNIIDEPKVYVNILQSNDFKLPTDDKGVTLSEKEVNDDSKWKYIPTQFRYNGKKHSMSGLRCDFYDVILHSKVIEIMCKNEELKSSILAYVVRKFSIFTENKYKIFTDNVKIIINKKYKSIKNIPEEFKISPSKKNEENSNSNKQEILNNLLNPSGNLGNNKSNSNSSQATNLMDEIKIPNKSENFPNTETFYNLPKNAPKNATKNAPQNAPKNAPQNAPNTKSNSTSKKILIQEIPISIPIQQSSKEQLKINFTKTILSEKEMEVNFDFSQFQDITMNNIDLQISENEIKLKLEDTIYIENEDYEEIKMNFNFQVNVDECKAKFNKSENKLKLRLVKQ